MIKTTLNLEQEQYDYLRDRAYRDHTTMSKALRELLNIVIQNILINPNDEETSPTEK